MVHELLGIQNGRVDLRMVPDIQQELSVSLMLSSELSPSIQPTGNNANDLNRPVFPNTLLLNVR
jgi:hypothetical protein